MRDYGDIGFERRITRINHATLPSVQHTVSVRTTRNGDTESAMNPAEVATALESKAGPKHRLQCRRNRAERGSESGNRSQQCSQSAEVHWAAYRDNSVVPWCGLAAATENVLANMQTRSVRL